MNRGVGWLKLSFLVGTVADLAVSLNWALIAAGVDLPNLICGFEGQGEAYRFAMYIAAVFMLGWAGLLAWGWFDPERRRGLLVITAALIALSIVLELLFYRHLLSGGGFVAGIAFRVAVIAKFMTSIGIHAAARRRAD